MSPGVKLRSGMILGLLLALGCGKTSSESPVMAGGASAEGGSSGGGEQSEACAPPHFEDPALEAAVRYTLSLDSGAELTGAQVAKLESLSVEDKVNSLAGIQSLCHLTGLYIKGGPGLTDLGPLASLSSLEHFSITDAVAGLTDFSPLASLSSLTHLDVMDAPGLTDLGPLAPLTSLRNLGVDSAPITSLEPLRGLTQLEGLSITGTSVEDISVLAGFSFLSGLTLGSSPIRDLSPLQGLSKLTWINMYNLPLENFNGIPKPASSRSCMNVADLPRASADVAADLEVHCKSGWKIGWYTTGGASGQCNNYGSCFR